MTAVHAQTPHAARFPARPPAEGRARSAGRRQRRAGRDAPPALAALPAPYWRTLLETRWQAELVEVTELSLAFHDAADKAETDTGPAAQRQLRQLQRLERHTATARLALAEIEDSLRRLSAGRYGYCEQCGASIRADRLLSEPEARFCQPCSPSPAATATIMASGAVRNLLTLLLAALFARHPRRAAARYQAARTRLRLPAHGFGHG
jgi:RNA polymerase-binding transcription factor DksA